MLDQSTIFGLQFLLSLIVYALLAKWYVAPWLAGKPVEQALVPLIFPHAFRHIGLLFLVPGVVAEPLPPEFANPAAYGDLAAAVLAILALIALRGGWGAALPLVWLFNVVGSVEFVLRRDPRHHRRRAGKHGRRLVHPDVHRSRAAGDALHGVRPAAAREVGRALISIFPNLLHTSSTRLVFGVAQQIST